jgi:anthranilate synthase/aminodeoxychorismate synthase-like glutamine amidotransferase
LILVIDHQDSFVYNLVQLVAVAGHEVRVVASDSMSAAELVELAPDGVILSPGPGRPERAGCFIDLIQALPDTTPLLGVCLGHQALGAAYGATVGRSPEPVHGKVSLINHQGQGIFANLPSPLEGGRYHSLMVEEGSLPAQLEVTARTDEGLVMAVQHRTRPQFGVQFHPESVLTPVGPQLVANYLALVEAAG